MDGQLLKISRIVTEDDVALGDFFEVLAADSETQHYFHPHPMTREAAADICRRATQGRDLYFVARDEGRVVGYAMLRGWDEGYEVPSFGVCVHPQVRNLGIGKQLLQHSIEACHTRNSPRLRLTVYKTNVRAVHVYQKVGFTFTDKNEQELIGLLELRSKGCAKIADAA